MKFTPTLNKEEFDKLSAAQKRVAIAQDVILRDEMGLFGTADDLDRKSIFLEERHEERFLNYNPKEFFNSNKCHVCAKGALICSWVGTFNSYSAYDVRNFGLMIERADRYPKEIFEIFGKEILDNIEKAFEGWYEFEGSKDEKNLASIMQNIVDNGGEFIPIFEE